MKTLSDKQKRINWDLTNELHLDDGRQIGGCPIFFHYRDVLQCIDEIKEELCQRPIGKYKLPCGTCINCKTIDGETGFPNDTEEKK